MPITEQERKDRRRYIGSSDIAAIIGADSWNTDYGVWMSKVHQINEPKKKNMSIIRGNLFEVPLVTYAAKTLGASSVVYDAMSVCVGHPIFRAQMDGHMLDRNEGIEVKTTGNYLAWEDGPPEYVKLQCQHQMMCFGMERVYVVADMPSAYMEGTEIKVRMAIKIYVVERNQILIDNIIDIGEDWWETHVIANVAPEMTEPPREEIYKWVARQANKVVELETKEIHEWAAKKDELKVLTKDVKDRQARITAKLGDGEAGKLDTGEVISYFANKNGTRTLKFPGKAYR